MWTHTQRHSGAIIMLATPQFSFTYTHKSIQLLVEHLVFFWPERLPTENRYQSILNKSTDMIHPCLTHIHKLLSICGFCIWNVERLKIVQVICAENLIMSTNFGWKNVHIGIYSFKNMLQLRRKMCATTWTHGYCWFRISYTLLKIGDNILGARACLRHIKKAGEDDYGRERESSCLFKTSTQQQ